MTMRIQTRSGSVYNIGPLGDVTRNGDFIGLLHSLTGKVGTSLELCVVVRKGQDQYDKEYWTSTRITLISYEVSLQELTA